MFRSLLVLIFGVALVICAANDVAASGVNERMIAAINRYRESFGLPALREDPVLMQVGPASDNLCQGAATPEEAVLDGWGGEDREKNPAGHNYQMRGLMNINGRWVDQRFDSVGVAVVGRNFIAIFGRRDGGSQYN